MEILASKRFVRAYEKGGLVMQGSAEHAVHDFVRRYRADGTAVTRQYDRIAGLPVPVLEIDIGRGDRLVASFQGDQLTLLDVGHHETVPRYDSRKLAQDLVDNSKAPDVFWPESGSPLFPEWHDMTYLPYSVEQFPDWVYWLDEEQDAAQHEIIGDAQGIDALLFRLTQRVFLLVGGPGTGKSCILLNLLKYYVDSGFEVGCIMAVGLVDYVEKSTGADISPYVITGDQITGGLDILLVDDPESIFAIRSYIDRAMHAGVRVAVLAFDPLQLDQPMTDQEYRDLLDAATGHVHVLSTCYRQKEHVGVATKATVDLIGASTPFLAKHKIKTYREERAQVTRIGNTLRFCNPGGYARVYGNFTAEDVKSEVQRIDKPWLLWPHWPGVLVVEPHSGALDPSTYLWLDKVPSVRITQDQITSIKGLEFQHVFLFLEREVYVQLTSRFRGSGQGEYNRRRLMRIPFSRAKDSLVTFVLP